MKNNILTSNLMKIIQYYVHKKTYGSLLKSFKISTIHFFLMFQNTTEIYFFAFFFNIYSFFQFYLHDLNIIQKWVTEQTF